jgi:cysteinyl-tRNA synthetase
MAAELLGTPFDIHGGGDDLIFPHHECENAQSRGLGQPNLAKYWIHVAPILYAGDKMSKSIGNLVFAKDILKDFPAPVIRLSLLKYHYRTGGEWQPEFLLEANELFQKLESAKLVCTVAAAETLLSDIRSALDDDLDSHLIMHALTDFVISPPKTDRDDSGEMVVSKVYKLLGLIN